MTASTVAALLAEAGFTLPDAAAAALASEFRPVALAKGEFLFLEGTASSALFVVETGEVEAVTSSLDGRELVFTTMGRAALIGEMTIVDGAVRSAGVRAVSDAVVHTIRRTTFMQHARREPEIGLALAHLNAVRARDMSQWAAGSSFESLASRLATVLLTLQVDDGSGGRHVVAPQRALGDRLGASRESINKWLRAWQRDGVVEIRRGRVQLIDVRRLERLATN